MNILSYATLSTIVLVLLIFWLGYLIINNSIIFINYCLRKPIKKPLPWQAVMVTLLATGFLIYISSGFTALFFFAFLLSSRLAFWLGPPATSLTSINQVADAATHAYIQYSTTIFWTLILLLSAWGWIGVISIKKIMKKKLYRPFADFKIWLLASFFVLSIPCIIIYLSHIDPFE